MSAVTVLGLGAMGSRLAANYSTAGHDVTVWNRSSGAAGELAASHGVTTAASVGEAVASADAVVSMVSNDEAAEAVWLGEAGAFANMRPDAVAIESSTLSPDAVVRLAEAAGVAGVSFVEAPVVGSRPQAESGALFYLLGGADSALDAAMPVIEVNAGNTIRVGAVGNAAQMKLAINGLFAAQVAAYAEIVGFLERSDLDTEAAIATLAALPITSPGLQRILGLIAGGDDRPNFPVRLVAKDLGYLARSSADLGAPLPLLDTARQVFEQGVADDLGDLDIAGIARRYRP